MRRGGKRFASSHPRLFASRRLEKARLVANRRIGVFGGTFDPIHYGHLAIAAEVRWVLKLEQIVFVVAAQQPFKRQEHTAPAQARLEMVQLACVDEPGFVPSDIELHRPPPSYTVDTLRALREQFVDCELWFLLGADAFSDLPQWREATSLIELAHLAVVARPGTTLDLATLDSRLPGLHIRTQQVTGPQLDISSTILRARIAEGQPVRYQMPDSVIAYIEEKKLYKA